MQISINNRQRKLSLKNEALRRLAAFFMRCASALRPRRRWERLEVTITDDIGISAAHVRLFGKAAVTDVLSIAYSPMPGVAEGWNGEILVNAERAAASCRRAPERELALYIAHGCDHLCGASDRGRKRRALMLKRENAWVRKAAAEGLLASAGATRHKEGHGDVA